MNFKKCINCDGNESVETIDSGVLLVADHEYDIRERPRCTWLPGSHVPKPSSKIFLIIMKKLIDTPYSGVFELAENKYDIRKHPRCTLYFNFSKIILFKIVKGKKGPDRAKELGEKCKAENKKCMVEDVLWIWADRKGGFIKGRREREQEKEKM